jgi:hypothetical protein
MPAMKTLYAIGVLVLTLPLLACSASEEPVIANNEEAITVGTVDNPATANCENSDSLEECQQLRDLCEAHRIESQKHDLCKQSGGCWSACIVMGTDYESILRKKNMFQFMSLTVSGQNGDTSYDLHPVAFGQIKRSGKMSLSVTRVVIGVSLQGYVGKTGDLNFRFENGDGTKTFSNIPDDSLVLLGFSDDGLVQWQVKPSTP